MNRYYGKEYDKLVLQTIEAGEKIQSEFFSSYINHSDKVLDFGCGRGKID